MKKIASWFKFDGVECNDKYCLLGIVKGIVQSLSWISLFLGLLFFLIILIFGGGPDSPRLVSILALFLGAIYFIVFYIISSVIDILVNIEENTRKTALLLGSSQQK